MDKQKLMDQGLREDQADAVLAMHQESVTALNTQVSDWEQKYNADTEALKQQLSDKDYGYAAEKFIGGYQFSSELAKKAAEAEFKAQEFTLKDGVFEGADAWMSKLKEQNPDAFQTEQPTAGVPRLVTNAGGAADKTNGVEAAFYGLNPALKQK